MCELPLAKCLISKSDQIGICFFLNEKEFEEIEKKSWKQLWNKLQSFHSLINNEWNGRKKGGNFPTKSAGQFKYIFESDILFTWLVIDDVITTESF